MRDNLCEGEDFDDEPPFTSVEGEGECTLPDVELKSHKEGTARCGGGFINIVRPDAIVKLEDEYEEKNGETFLANCDPEVDEGCDEDE